MRYKVITEKLCESVKDGDGNICGRVTTPSTLFIEYDNNDIIPSEPIFSFEPINSLVEVVKRNDKSLLVKMV